MIFNKKVLKNLDDVGRIPLTENIEDHLCSFIKQCNSLEISIRSAEVINEAIKLVHL